MKKQVAKVSYHKKPANLSTDDWQRELRKQFVAEKAPLFIIEYLDGEHPVFADYSVKNPASGGIYKVALRARKSGPNFCSCMDFKTNMLGTCKHTEAIFHHISKNGSGLDFWMKKTDKRYLKIPVENEQIIEKAAETLMGFLALLKKP